ncbi:hypothetical protein CFP56_004840 [Quercus suber]|uniref:Uncharacterized protein n=1 Tax=Quercus suber TaxID=58331 RepID=A0AAW0M9A5_QUESU
MINTTQEELRYSSDRYKICMKVQDVQEQGLCFPNLKKRSADEGDEYYLDHIPGMVTRYSYDDLQYITANFKKELGAGGFARFLKGL